MADTFITGEVRPLIKRGISEATCTKFGYRVGQDRAGKTVQIADYRDADGVVVCQKVRYADKTFMMLGDGKDAPLFGQNLWQTGGRRVVITEGEIDAMSLAQVFNLTWPVVSLPSGASAAKKSILKNLEWLESFEQVVLCFDMDEPGRAAAAECAPLFTPGKCAVAEMSLKDANEMLVAGKVKELTSAIWQARVYRPDGIVTLAEIEDRVLTAPEVGMPWFLPGLTKATYGRRKGELIGIGGGTGCGKTDFITQQVAYDIMTLGLTVGVLFLEQSVGETGRRIAGKNAGKRYHAPDGSWTTEELKETWGTLKATNRLHLYDSWGTADWATIKSRINYMVQSLGCDVIYLDHLTACAATEADERVALERIMAEAASLSQALQFCFIYVSHLATPEGKPHEEGGRVTIRNFKGSRSIGFWSHTMFGIERDTQDRDAPTTIRGLKHRFTGDSNGMTFGMRYDRATGLLSECELKSDSPFDDETTSGASGWIQPPTGSPADVDLPF